MDRRERQRHSTTEYVQHIRMIPHHLLHENDACHDNDDRAYDRKRHENDDDEWPCFPTVCRAASCSATIARATSTAVSTATCTIAVAAVAGVGTVSAVIRFVKACQPHGPDSSSDGREEHETAQVIKQSGMGFHVELKNQRRVPLVAFVCDDTEDGDNGLHQEKHAPQIPAHQQRVLRLSFSLLTCTLFLEPWDQLVINQALSAATECSVLAHSAPLIQTVSVYPLGAARTSTRGDYINTAEIVLQADTTIELFSGVHGTRAGYTLKRV